MKLIASDLGICGVEQAFFAGSIKFDTENASEEVELCKLPANVIITRVAANVKTAFNASDTNKITVGTDDEVSNLFSDSDITAGTARVYNKLTFAEASAGTAVKAKLEASGATAGEAEIYCFAVGIPEVSTDE